MTAEEEEVSEWYAELAEAPAEVTELLDLASEEEGFTEELEVFSSSRELEEDFDISTEEEDVSEPAEVTVEEEISATGSEDAALVLSSQAVRKQSVKAKKMDPIALEFIPDLFLSAPG